MTEVDSETPALAVGAIMGDIDSEREWGDSIGALSRKVKMCRGGVVSPIRLSVVFHVEGRISPNEFQGVRAGRLRKRDNHLIVQAAVPARMIEGRNEVLVALLRDAVSEAEGLAKKRGISSELAALRALVEDVAG